MRLKNINFNDNKMKLIVFKTKWCGDCKMMEPVVEDLKKWTQENKIEVDFINIDAEYENVFRKNGTWNVSKVPSFHFVTKENEIIFIGYEYIPITKFQKIINEKK